MEQNEKIEHLRHSLAHLLASAVLELYPNTKNTIGPAVDNGFYYDFEFSKPITNDDLSKIEQKMRETLKTWKSFEHKEVSKAEAIKHFSKNPYKIELIEDIVNKGEKITLYTSGNFTDLCRGGHSEIKVMSDAGWKLSHIAGAYWRGDEKNKMLTRIYGLAFENKNDLESYEKIMAEAEKRDHRKIGKEMEIFSFDDDVGPGLPLWLPNGTIIIDELEKLAEEMESKSGYVKVKTPHLAKESMYQKSGHLPYYQDSMFPAMEYEGGKYYLKAMNCPHHHKIYSFKPRSYKDLPIRFAEYGTCYRHEKSGELFGIMRARSLHMNDAHIYCTEEQFFDEFKKVIDLYLEYFKIFGIEKYVMRLSKHSKEKLGKKYVDEPVLWEKTEKMVRDCLVDLKINFVEAKDEAAFYGPKIDVQIWSAIGREFTLATNQVDFAVPKRFNLEYTEKDGSKSTPICIHRAPLSTHERMIGFLIEHYSGVFPLWLSPVQIKIIPIGENEITYATKIEQMLKENGIRVSLDDSNESLGKKIRGAKIQKIPYIAVIGKKEVDEGTVALESRTDSIKNLPISKMTEKLLEEIKNRS